MITSYISALTVIVAASTRYHYGARTVLNRDISRFAFSHSKCVVLSTTFKRKNECLLT